MKRHFLSCTVAPFALLCAIAQPAVADPGDAQIAAIVDEGLNRSEAMVMASQLMDGIGPRLTNSENHRKAEDWAAARLEGMGLKNVHRESFRFGLGWNLDGYSARMISPRPLALTALPVAWSPPTDGTVRGEVIVAPIRKREHLEAWKGKLAGKIVLLSMPGTSSEPTKPAFERLDGKAIGELDSYELPRFDPAGGEEWIKPFLFQRELSEFLKAEGAIAMARISYRDGKLVHGEGYFYRPGETLALPSFEIAAEDYRRLVRLAQAGKPPVVELALQARYDSKDLDADNLIADIPGSDPKAGYVMAGAHFDSWIAGDGAADNGAGSVVVMESARILSRLGVKPKRTIRFALWSGEEQGLLGSRAYIEKHLATRGLDPATHDMEAYMKWQKSFPIKPLADHGALKAYFNIDNGSGKIRGIHAENNVAAVPVLRKWLAPFDSLGAGTVVMSKTDGTDHVFMQAVGLPAYQFIQDPLDYGSRVHHSSIDTVDHLRGDDLRQAATVLAGLLLQAANSSQELPRLPLPTQPAATDPFKVADPDK